MASDICAAVGKRIRMLRKARGWRQIDLAAHSGINVIHLSHVERGKKELGLRNLQILALTFECTLSEFLKDL
jgi:XRE family aerobic/anaerobic benzoate catabolism transcriptional regulator